MLSACAQRGVDLPSLDVTYFTSLSYYILLLFGLRGVFMLFFRDEVVDETQVMPISIWITCLQEHAKDTISPMLAYVLRLSSIHGD